MKRQSRSGTARYTACNGDAERWTNASNLIWSSVQVNALCRRAPFTVFVWRSLQSTAVASSKQSSFHRKRNQDRQHRHRQELPKQQKHKSHHGVGKCGYMLSDRRCCSLGIRATFICFIDGLYASAAADHAFKVLLFVAFCRKHRSGPCSRPRCKQLGCQQQRSGHSSRTMTSSWLALQAW